MRAQTLFYFLNFVPYTQAFGCSSIAVAATVHAWVIVCKSGIAPEELDLDIVAIQVMLPTGVLLSSPVMQPETPQVICGIITDGSWQSHNITFEGIAVCRYDRGKQWKGRGSYS